MAVSKSGALDASDLRLYEAVAQVGAAGRQHPVGRDQRRKVVDTFRAEALDRGGEKAGDARERLRDRVVQLDREARALAHAEDVVRMGGFLLQQLAAHAHDEAAEDSGPAEEGEKSQRQKAENRQEPLRRPPGRPRKQGDVLRRAHDEREPLRAREMRQRRPVLGVDDADAVDGDPVAEAQAAEDGGVLADVNRHQDAVVVEMEDAVAVFGVGQGDDRSAEANAMPVKPGFAIISAFHAGVVEWQTPGT